MTVADQLTTIQATIEKSCEKVDRDPSEVKVIAVTKYVTPERALEAVQAGVHHLAENRMEGIEQKQSVITSENIAWHFIGTLQSRKAKHVVNRIQYLHSLDRLSLAEQIEKYRENVLDCFIQVNISGEESKHGLSESELLPFIDALKAYQKIRVIGLMTMAPHTDNEMLIRKVFQRLKQWQLRIRDLGYSHAPCQELSMGMSNDYALAIEEGATFVRIGTALVGNDK
ncbi:UPF0001 protein YlmE [Pullulanibacillus camelliae]|uniref:Pyridoxal phosphate homeostasis protein n=1 Tax=Pullulanibacillus camelliae TaxID=1707096 RepID=A0A8J2VUE6_9BACL|nr:YggS family pyridoxal phosphate-dependent enzyme [Pullulanibacillus camelliae]GGE41433.1 UPF0001 protein YlmE [Pullulanibacillus camelliae]